MKQKKIPEPARILLVLAGIIISFFLTLKILPYPNLKEFTERQNSTAFYDCNGKLLYITALDEGLRREFTPLKEIPESVKKEFINEEDAHFYFHPGFDVFSMTRAFFQNRKNHKIVSGASTITMQLVRIINPRKAKINSAGKIKEILMAVWLESKFSKKQILEMYLNNVPFGFQTEGVTSAARSFYDTTLDSLTAEQISVLAKIPRRPSEYAPKKICQYKNLCPHYINYITDLCTKKNEKLPAKMNLSMDYSLYLKSRTLLQNKLGEYEKARVHNGSAFAINNQTGQILLWVGNASFFDKEHSGEIDGVQVKNQPGSSMKPFLYAQALETGHKPSDILSDVPQFYGATGVYIPRNFNNKFNGPVSMRVALASSLNVPAVILLSDIGISNYMSLLDELGYESLKGTRASTGLSIALGSCEVTLYEMVKAFSVFTKDGEVFEDLKFTQNSEVPRSHRIFKKDTCRILCDFLSDRNARSLGFGNPQVFRTNYPCIFKTGTSNQFQNIIALASTKKYTVGVWMGNFEGETVIGETGSSIPANLARLIMDSLMENEDYSDFDFPQPENFIKTKVCSLSGSCPTKDCPNVTEEYIEKSSLNTYMNCSWHSTDSMGRTRITYPSEYQHWADGKNYSASINYSSSTLQITYPNSNAIFVFDPGLDPSIQQLNIQATGGSQNTADLYVDGKFMGTQNLNFSWIIPLEKGNHQIEIICGNERRTTSYTVK